MSTGSTRAAVGGAKDAAPASGHTTRTLAVRQYDDDEARRGSDFDPYFIRGYDCNDPDLAVYVINLREGVGSEVLLYITQCFTALDRYLSITNKLFPSLSRRSQSQPQLLYHARDAPPPMWDFKVMRMIAAQIIQRAFRGHWSRKLLFRRRSPLDQSDFISLVIRNRAAICIQRCSRLRHGLLKRFWLLATIQEACRGVSIQHPVLYLDSWVYFLLLRYSHQHHQFIGEGDSTHPGTMLLPNVSPRIRQLWPEFQGYPGITGRGEGVIFRPFDQGERPDVHVPSPRPESKLADEARGHVHGQGQRTHSGPSCGRLRIHRLSDPTAGTKPVSETDPQPPPPTRPGDHHHTAPHRKPHMYKQTNGHASTPEDPGFSRPVTAAEEVSRDPAEPATAVSSSTCVGIGDGDEDDDAELALNLEADKQLPSYFSGDGGYGDDEGGVDGRGAEISAHMERASIADTSASNSLVLIQERSVSPSNSGTNTAPDRNSPRRDHKSAGSPRNRLSAGHGGGHSRSRSRSHSHGSRRPHTVTAAGDTERSPRSVHSFTMHDFPSPRASPHHTNLTLSTDTGARTTGKPNPVNYVKTVEESLPCKLFDLMTKHVHAITMKIVQPQDSSTTAMGIVMQHSHTATAPAPTSAAPVKGPRRHSTASAPIRPGQDRYKDDASPEEDYEWGEAAKQFLKPPKYNVKAGALRVVELRFKTVIEARTRMAQIIIATFDGFQRRSWVPMSEATLQLRVNDNAVMINAHVRPPPKAEAPMLPVGHLKLDHTRNVRNTEHGEKGVDTNVLENSILVRSDNKFKSLMTRPLSGVAVATKSPAGKGSSKSSQPKAPTSPAGAVAQRGREEPEEPVVLNDTSIEPQILLQPHHSYPRAILACASRCAELPPPKDGDYESPAAYQLSIMKGEVPASNDIQLFALFCYILSLRPEDLQFMYTQLRSYLLPRGKRLAVIAEDPLGSGTGADARGDKDEGRVLVLPGSAVTVTGTGTGGDGGSMFRIKDATDALPAAIKRSGCPCCKDPNCSSSSCKVEGGDYPPLDDEIGDDWDQEQDTSARAHTRKVEELTARAAEENHAKAAEREARSKRRHTTFEGGGTSAQSLNTLAYESPLLYQDFQKLKGKGKGNGGLVEKRAMVPPPLPGAAPTVAMVERNGTSVESVLTGEQVEEAPRDDIPEGRIMVMKNSLLLWCSQLEKRTIPAHLPGSEPEIVSVEREEKVIPKLPTSFNAAKSCYMMTITEALVLASTVIEPEFAGSQTDSHYTTFSEKKAEAEAHIKGLERAMSLERLEVLNHYKLHKHRIQQKMKQRERQRLLQATLAAKPTAVAMTGLKEGDGTDLEDGSSLESASVRLQGSGEVLVGEGTVDDLIRAAQGDNGWVPLSPGRHQSKGQRSSMDYSGGTSGRPKSAAKAKLEAKLAFTRHKNKVDREELHAEVDLLRQLEQQRREQSRFEVRTEEAKALECAAEAREVRHRIAKMTVYTQEIDNAIKLEGRDVDAEERLEAKLQKKHAEDALKSHQKDYRNASRDSCNLLAQLARKEHAAAAQALQKAKLKAKQDRITRARLGESESKQKLHAQKEVERLSKRYGRPSSAGAPRKGKNAVIGNNIQLGASQLVEDSHIPFPFDDSVAETMVNQTAILQSKAQRLSVHIDGPKNIQQSHSQAHAQRRGNTNSIISHMLSGEISSWQEQGLGLNPMTREGEDMTFSASLVDVSTAEPLPGGNLTGNHTASAIPQYSSSTVPTTPQVNILPPTTGAVKDKGAKQEPSTPFSPGTVSSGKAAINSYFAKQLAASAASTNGSKRPASASATTQRTGSRQIPAGNPASPPVPRGKKSATHGGGNSREKLSVSQVQSQSLQGVSLSDLVAPLSDLIPPYSEEEEMSRNRGPPPEIRQYAHLRAGAGAGKAGSGVVGIGIGFESTGSGSGSGSGAWKEGGGLSASVLSGPGSASSSQRLDPKSGVNIGAPSPYRGVPPSYGQGLGSR